MLGIVFARDEAFNLSPPVARGAIHGHADRGGVPQATDKRPREYAAEIIAQPDRAERRKMLARVPEGFRDWVRGYVEQYSARLNASRRRG